MKLGGDEVHLWFVPSLNADPLRLETLWTSLTADETERADRFHFREDRNRFIAARGILREILSWYLGCTPGRIRFGYQSSGKPEIRFPASERGLRFNLSHCGDAAFYGVSRGREIGVDIEMIRSGPWDKIAGKFFTPAEIERLRSLRPDQQIVGFFDCWTRKEAYVKALGGGLSTPFDTFHVSPVSGEASALLNASGPHGRKRWSVKGVRLGKGFAGASAVEGNPDSSRLFCWNYPGSAPRE